MRKAMGEYEINKMCAEYDKRCTFKGTIKLTKEELKQYINANDKTAYLKSIGKCFA